MISRQLVEGDVVVFAEEGTPWGLTKGKEYKVRKDGDGDYYIKDDVNDTMWIYDEDYRCYTLKEDIDSLGYISVVETQVGVGVSIVLTLEVDEIGLQSILALESQSQVAAERRTLQEQITTLQKRLEALDNA